MPNSSTICVDAHLVFRLVANPNDQPIASQWRAWSDTGRQFIAPSLLRYEVINALHRLRRSSGAISQFTEAAWNAALALPIGYVGDDDLHWRALVMADRFILSAAYDAHYLALADREGIAFFTADRRLANSVGGHLPWVHYVDPTPSSPNSR